MALDKLSGIRIKVERAKEHIRDLEGRMAALKNPSAYSVIEERYPQTAERVFRFKRHRGIPPEVPLRCGEALQNLRTALDYLVVALVLKNGGVETRFTGYPIFCTAAEYKAGRTRKMQGVSQTAMDAIDATEPYNGGKGEAFWWLRQLNDREKHRMLLTAGLAVRVTDVIPQGVGQRGSGVGRATVGPAFRSEEITPPNTVFPIKDGAIFFTIPEHVDVNLEFAFEVAFNEPAILHVKGKPILPTIHQIADLTDGVIGALTPLII